MRNKLLIVIFFYTTNLSAQKCFEILGQDSLKIYFDTKGILVNNQNAEMYRVYKSSPDYFPFNGYFRDYYLNDTLAFIGKFYNGYVNGPFSYFDKNGKLLVKGNYKNGEKDGIWEYYYPQGNLYKRISFLDKVPKIIEEYKKNGKAVIINGNGKYQGTIKTGYNKTADTEISGNVVDGLPDGKWHIQYYFGQATEVFENGRFVSGINYEGKKYDQPLTSFIDYMYVEYVNAFRFNCFIDNKIFSAESKVEYPILIETQVNSLNYFGTTNITLPAYKNKYDFNLFQSDLIKQLNNESDISFWAFVEFTIGSDGSLADFKIFSPFDNVDKTILKALNQTDKFIPATNSESKNKYSSYIFFPIIKQQDKTILIPKFDNGIIGLQI